jgi:hypothetical protein
MTAVGVVVLHHSASLAKRKYIDLSVKAGALARRLAALRERPCSAQESAVDAARLLRSFLPCGSSDVISFHSGHLTYTSCRHLQNRGTAPAHVHPKETMLGMTWDNAAASVPSIWEHPSFSSSLLP